MAPDTRRHLARAGWSILRPASAPEPGSPPQDFESLGARLVCEVASSWTRKYKFTIKKLGHDGKCAFHYECIFSCPTNHLPVPAFILSTRFAFITPTGQTEPRLLYAFEEGDLRHEWALSQTSGQWQAVTGQQYCSLGDGHFERYIDRLIYEKEQARDQAWDRGVDLRTSFEATRLEKPPAYSEEGTSEEESEEELEHGMEVNILRQATDPAPTAPEQSTGEEQGMALVMREALQAAGLYCDKVTPPASLAELLACIFDAADEETVGELPHYEVARLLSATLPGFGLELWDIHLLMTSAQENDDGFIECKPFIQAAPEIIHALRKRRMAYRERGLPGVEVPQEAVKHCFTDDATATANQLTKVFEQCVQEEPSCGKWTSEHSNGKQDQQQGHHQHHRSRTKGQDARGSMGNGHGTAAGGGPLEDAILVGIKRRFCQDCISSLPERLSPQEAMRLMQMLPEDEEGFIMIEELVEYLEHLRTDAMLNALVESDVLSLRTHLVLRFRHLGLAEDGKLNLWVIKEALLQADQVCLTRLQIHTLLCLANPDSFGLVNIAEFLGMCCVVIPHMFDAKLFVEAAEGLILEHAESQRRAENEELAALGAARVGQTGGEGEETQENKEVDQETVERILQQILSLNDDLHRTPPALPPDQIYSILGVNEKEVQTTQLSTFELTGFAAEMRGDADGFVPYVDHIKKWVPIIFELRKDRLLTRYVEPDSSETLGIGTPDLQKLEQVFPLLPFNSSPPIKRGSQRRSSRHSRERTGSIMSNAPSHSRVPSKQESGDGDTHHRRSHSKNHLDPVNRRGSRLQTLGGRHPSGHLDGSKRRESTENRVESKQKEPPPGRGFQRRKQRLLAMEAEAQMAATHH